MVLKGEFDVLPGEFDVLIEDLTDDFFELRIALKLIYCAEVGRNNIDLSGIIENIDFGGVIELGDGLDW